MRTVLVGAVESTQTALRVLAAASRPPIAVVTLPKEASQRHSDFVDLRPDCQRLGIPLIEVLKSNDNASIETFRRLEPDVLMVVGWSQLLHDEVLRTPRIGTLGYHPALLPENRGRAVIPWTILQGATETGSTLFWIDKDVDSGDIAAQIRIRIAPDETARTLYNKHLVALEQLVQKVSADLEAGRIVRVPQDHTKASWCARRRPEDGWIDWRQSAHEVWTLIRASTLPYPGAITTLRDKRLTCWEALFAGEGPYWGLPGQVQRVSEEGVLVQCGDRRHILLSRVSFDGVESHAATLIKLHERLGRVQP